MIYLYIYTSYECLFSYESNMLTTTENREKLFRSMLMKTYFSVIWLFKSKMKQMTVQEEGKVTRIK